jgi:hypothetical protein
VLPINALLFVVRIGGSVPDGIVAIVDLLQVYLEYVNTLDHPWRKEGEAGLREHQDEWGGHPQSSRGYPADGCARGQAALRPVPAV